MSHSAAFVRHDQIPPSPPPSTAAGPVAWLKTNLFNGWFNTILTLAAFYFIYLLAVGIVPWMANGVWNTNSLRECREALAGDYGACFSVLSERWNQLLFGIAYPSDQYWRPTIAFVLLFVAAAPVLFFDLPRKLLIFTGIYPFIAYWLIWGGTIWAPIFALLGFVAGYFAYSALVKDSFAKGAGAGVAAAFVVWIGSGYIIPSIASDTPWLDPVASRDMGGFMLNMILGTVCVSLSLPLGILLALGRQSDMPIIKGICVVFIEFIRGVPLITLLFVANVVLAYFFPPGSNIDLILRVIIMITM
ncbi:MAG: amino acid ABC transporter permease, partial [Pseudomonadota bacterium]